MIEIPSFSVIIPVYNGARYLRETLVGALAQSYKPKEIIVIDDGSTDDSAAVARSFGDVVTVVSRENCGVSASRNFGASIATGSWLAFLDADDLWDVDHLAGQVEAMGRNSGADFCYSGRRLLVEDRVTGAFKLGELVFVPNPEELKKIFLETCRCPFIPSVSSIRASIFAEEGGFDGAFNGVEDWDMWLRLHRRGIEFIKSAKSTVYYRVHSASATNDPLPVLKKSIGVVEKDILAFLPPLQRILFGRRVISRLECEAAILLRQNHLPGALRLMLRALVRNPFCESQRYKVAAHMIFRGLRRDKQI
jgi:glycosyltransferase involved in cell wall biosynthesis